MTSILKQKGVDLNTVEGTMKAVKAIGNRMRSVMEDMHPIAMACLRHAAPEELGGHGDVTLVQALYDQFPTSNRGQSALRRQAFAVWVQAHTPVFLVDRAIKANRDRQPKLYPADHKLFVEWDLAGAEETPFWDYTTEEVKKTAPYDYLNTLFSTRARLIRDHDGENDKAEFVGTEDEYTQTLAVFDRMIEELGGDEAQARLKKRKEALLEEAAAA